VLAAFDARVRDRRFVKGHNAVDDGSKAASVQLNHPSEIFSRPHRAAANVDLFPEDAAYLYVGDRSAGRSVSHNAPARSHEIEGMRECVTARPVDDDVRAAADDVEQCAWPGAGVIGDAVNRAMPLRQRDLRVST